VKLVSGTGLQEQVSVRKDRFGQTHTRGQSAYKLTQDDRIRDFFQVSVIGDQVLEHPQLE
jgi:hypothetical protein